MDDAGRGRHRVRGGGVGLPSLRELPERMRSGRRAALRRVVRATGSRSAAVITFVVLAVVAWILADVLVGEPEGGRGKARGDAAPRPTPAYPGIEAAAVAAAGPSADGQALPTPTATPAPTSAAPAGPGGPSAAPAPPASSPSSPPPSSPSPSSSSPPAAAPSVPPAAPPVAPRPAGPVAPAPAPPGPVIAHARQYSLMVRSAPTQRSDLVTTVPNNTPVTVVCHTTGPSVMSFTGRSTTTWDRIRTPDGTSGYVSDGWLLTPGDVTRLVPEC